jgi:hypothetical protein
MSKQFDDFKKFTLMDESPSAPASDNIKLGLNNLNNVETIREVYPANVENSKEFIDSIKNDDEWDNHQGDIVHW